MKIKKILTVSVLIVSMLFMSFSIPAAQASPYNPAILPPQAVVQGMTLGEWHAELFRATYAIPEAEHPGLGFPWPYCSIERIGNVGLVVTSWISEEIECEMPVGMMLYFLVIGSECSTAEPPPFYGGNEEELRTCALSWAPSNLEASIDGIQVENIDQYTALSPLYQLELPAGNVLYAAPGTYDSVAYANGFILAPLTPGEHTIEISGAIHAGDFEVYRIYHITVTN